MLDIPLHGNQIATLLRLLSGTELNASSLEINWFTPYWLGYASVALLGLCMPILTAIKIILSLTVIATPWLAARLRELVSNDNSRDWLFLPVIYSFSFQAGLFNFIVGIPLILLFLRKSILYFQTAEVNFRTKFTIVFLSHILFFTHILSLAFSLLIALSIGIFLSEDVKKSIKNRSLKFINKQFFLHLLPFFSSFPIIICWLFHVKPHLFHLYNFQNSIPILIINLYRFLIMLSSATGFIYFYKMGIVYAIILLFLPNSKILRNWRALPFAITVLILLFVPTGSNGGNFIAERFNVFIFIFYVFSFDFSRMNEILTYTQRSLLFAFASFFVLMTTTYKTLQFDKETQGLKNIIAKMEPHHSVAAIIDDLGEKYAYPVFGSITYWYHTEKNGYGNSFFSIPSSIVQFKTNVSNPFPPSQFLLSEYQWDKNALKFDYFIIKGNISTFSSAFLSDLKKYTQPIYHEGEWHLYLRHTKTSAITAKPA